MHLQKRMITHIDQLYGHQEFTSQLRKYSKLTTSKHRMRYIFIINAINELYLKEDVDLIVSTTHNYTTVVKAIEILSKDNLIFKSAVISLMVEMMEYNLNYIKGVKLLRAF